eukprot:11887788-Alexandrium_andersonii.AAC.1
MGVKRGAGEQRVLVWAGGARSRGRWRRARRIQPSSERDLPRTAAATASDRARPACRRSRPAEGFCQPLLPPGIPRAAPAEAGPLRISRIRLLRLALGRAPANANRARVPERHWSRRSRW